MSTRPVVRPGRVLAAAVLTTAAAGIGVLAAPPAEAAGCSGATGVTVVVDHGALGGGVDQSCNAGGGGKSATTQFTSVGYSFTYVQRQPGFVCRINGQPASDPCVNTPPVDAYWGLWWSDGASGTWSYSSVAAGSLTIPDGGYVAFAWQGGSRSAPGVPAPAHPSSPTSAPTSTPTGGGGNGGGKGGGGGSHGSATPTTKPSPSVHASPSTKPSSAAPSPTTATSASASGSVAPSTRTPDQTSSAPAEATESPTAPPTSAAADTSSAPTAPEDDRVEVTRTDQATTLPVWVVPLVLLVLAAGGAAAYLVRRRGRAHP